MQRTQNPSRRPPRTGPQHISSLMQAVLRRYNIDLNLDFDAEPEPATPVQLRLFDEQRAESPGELVAHCS